MSLGSTYFYTVRRDPGIVCYWRLNDAVGSSTAIDYAAVNNLNGFYNGPPTLGQGPLIQGDLSSASVQIATGQSVTVGDIAALRLVGDISIEMWVVPLAASQNAALMSKGTVSVAAKPYSLTLVAGVPVFTFGNGTTTVTATSSSALAVSVPSHVVARSFRGAMAIFINGVQTGTASLGALTPLDGADSLYIGNSHATAPFNGLIGEVSLYSQALSTTKIVRRFVLAQTILADQPHYTTIDPPSYS